MEVWDFRRAFPTKITSIDKPSTLQKVVGNSFFIHNLSPKFYLVKTSTDILFIKWFIGDFVNAEGLLVDEDYVLYNSKFCPYRTKLFYVYRLNFRQNTWEQVESLNDQVVFLGGNQSISLSSHDLLDWDAWMRQNPCRTRVWRGPTWQRMRATTAHVSVLRPVFFFFFHNSR